MIKKYLKKLLLIVIPKSLFAKGKAIFFYTLYKRTKNKFMDADPNENFLSISDLRKMQLQFKHPPEYGYSKEILDKRGRERADYLLKLVPRNIESTLELGCWDGMVSYHLMKKGKKAIGIDNRNEGFDSRALIDKVCLIQMDASDLKLKDNSVDLVFSYDAFEHFSNPEKVMSEIYRVLKPNGYIYLEFGPLFMSPMGLHVYRQITVPYCQFLFSENTLIEFVKEKKLESIDFNHCNGWSLTKFRDLWKTYDEKLIKLKYEESKDYRHLKIINKYPSLFKNKTENFENLICSSISVFFQKK
ncbi:class I SAM-dependent methyltransferase [Gaetbulibacter sp. M240]|uniref:class I SAM-dependent methyltransferase n=1 Tax=Gaetbulibacter sp. M240 TaxID=3126511 RepID=UPI00374E34F7